MCMLPLRLCKKSPASINKSNQCIIHNKNMELTALPKIIKRPKKRVGRGYGSGKGGHSSGRGFKGQHARNSVAIWFEGGQLPLIKRLPFQRGKGRFNSLHAKPVIVTLNQLNVLPVGSVVTVELLVKHKII